MTYETGNLFYPNPQSGISFNMQIDTGDVFSLTDFNSCVFIHLTAGTIITKVWLHVPFKKSVNYILMQPTLIDYVVGSGGILWGSNILPNPVYPNDFVYGTLSFKVDYKLNICCDGMAGIAEKADDLWNGYNHLFEPAQIGMQMHTLKEHKNYELISSNPYDARNWREIPKITNGDYDLIILTESNPVEVPRTGNYVFIPFKTENYNWKYNPSGISLCEHKNNHNEIRTYQWVDEGYGHGHKQARFRNAMFMQNDDCDGFIWEKKHTPNDYIIFYPFYGPGWFRVYPNDKYVLRDNGLYNIVSPYSYLFRVGDFLVGVRSVSPLGGEPYGEWIVSRDSKKWKKFKTDYWIKSYVGSWGLTASHKDNFGIFCNQNGVICTFSLDLNTGEPTINTSDVNEGNSNNYASIGGYYLYTRKDDTKPHKTVYQLSVYGNRQIEVSTNWTGTLYWRTYDQYQICIGTYNQTGVRFIAYSTNGFASYSEITSLNEIQNYGDNWGVTYFDKQFYSYVRRADAVIPNKYYWDCKQIITGSKVWQDTLRTYDAELCGNYSYEPRQHAVPHDGHTAHITKYAPGVENYVSMNGGPIYFKDGKISEPFGWAMYIIGDYTNTNFTAILGNCNENRKEAVYTVPPFDDCPGSFMFTSSNSLDCYLIDPRNDTWNLPW